MMAESRAARIASLYGEMLGRFPDPQGLETHLRSEHSLEAFREAIIGSDEYRNVEAAVERVGTLLASYPGQRRFLLFGAYGNGNLGDREMARLIGGWVEENGHGVCLAHSELDLLDYPFPSDRKLQLSRGLLNSRVMGLFDGLIVGGGGLLAYPHEPLWDPAWAHLIPVPHALFACGVGTPIDHRLTNLVKGARGATGRDEQSAAELRKHNRAAFVCPDPILALLKVPEALDPKPDPKGRCFILRGPANAWHADLSGRMTAEDRVVLLEAGVDWQLLYMFPQALIAHSLDELAKIVLAAEFVVSERYHGAIVSLLCGRPTVGVYRGDHNASKIRSLFRDLGLDPFCQPTGEIPRHPRSFPAASVQERLVGTRELFRDRASKIMSILEAGATVRSE